MVTNYLVQPQKHTFCINIFRNAFSHFVTVEGHCWYYYWSFDSIFSICIETDAYLFSCIAMTSLFESMMTVHILYGGVHVYVIDVFIKRERDAAICFTIYYQAFHNGKSYLFSRTLLYTFQHVIAVQFAEK